MTITVIINPKGGVAKSTSITNLAAISAAEGKKTLLIDLDPQGTSSRNVGVPQDISDSLTSAMMFLEQKKPSELILSTEYDFDVIPAGARQGDAESILYSMQLGETLLNTLIKSDKGLSKYDHIFIDTPGHRSKVLTAALVAGDSVICPMNASKASTDQGNAVLEIIETVNQFKLSMNQKTLDNHGFFFTNVNERTNASKDNIVEFSEETDARVLDVYIPHRTAVENALIKRTPLVHFDPESDAAKSYYKLYQQTIGS